MRIQSWTRAAGALSALSLSLIAGIAHADSVTYSSAFGPVLANGSTNVSLSTFNSSLGTLQSVTLTLTSSSAGTLLLTNNTTDPLSYTGGTYDANNFIEALRATAKVQGLDGLQVSNVGRSGFGQGTVAGTNDPNNPTNVTINGSPISGTAASASGNISPYVTNGAATLGVKISAGSILVDGALDPGLGATPNITTSGLLSVTYNYTASNAAPEPGSVAMLGTGLLGMAGIGIRRRKKSAA